MIFRRRRLSPARAAFAFLRALLIAFALIYLPAEKILIEADAFTPLAASAPAPAKPNPYSVNLYENVHNLNLDVRKIAALHGPRVTTLADLQTAIAVN